MTLEEARKKRDRAIDLLAAHEDQYRQLYVKAGNLKSNETNQDFWFERSIAKVKSECIKDELEHLDLLISYLERAELEKA